MYRVLVPLIATFVASGCYTVNASLPGTLRSDVAQQDYERIGVVTIEKNHWFYIYGLVGEVPPDFFAPEIKKAVQQKGGDGLANINYQSEFGCLDLIISQCTAGCVVPRTYKLTGDIVRIKKAPPPGRPPAVASLDRQIY